MNHAEKTQNTNTQSAAPTHAVETLRTENQQLYRKNTHLSEENKSLKDRVAWFEKQLFGQKSEKRKVEDNPLQGSLLTNPTETPTTKEDKISVTYERGTAKKNRPEDCVTGSGLRFNEDVPVEVIDVIPDELKGDNADEYEVIGTKESHKLAQRPASYVVLCYRIPVVKHKESSTPKTTIMPDQVLESSLADVSLIVGLLVDKFQYHLPLYRQHQRIQNAGITISRATLTNITQRGIELLRPVVEAMLKHVLQSKVLAMDETPIKAGKKQKGKLKQGYFWPIYGEDDEIVFTYHSGRGRQHIENILQQQFQGTLLTDGYAAYARYVEKTEGVDHAQCWAHTRRKFIEAEAHYPELSAEIVDLIRQLYAAEEHIRDQNLKDDKKRGYRLDHSKVVIGEIVAWCHRQLQTHAFSPKDTMGKAIGYLLNREDELKTFLENPDAAIDTNHLEREIRPIPMGRKNWLFCWSELGAEHVGLIQSLISTCKLHGINPHTYLTDVLQRVSQHPASKVEELTPRLWKGLFGNNPLRSPLERDCNYVRE